MNNIYYTWKEFEQDIPKIINLLGNFKPDMIVSIVRGGACLGTVLSHKLGVPVLYMTVNEIQDELICAGKILFVDDINDSGNTINAIKNDIDDLLSNISKTEYIIKDNIKYLTIYNNTNSCTSVDFSIYNIDKKKEEWVVFPWEQ